MPTLTKWKHAVYRELYESLNKLTRNWCCLKRGAGLRSFKISLLPEITKGQDQWRGSIFNKEDLRSNQWCDAIPIRSQMVKALLIMTYLSKQQIGPKLIRDWTWRGSFVLSEAPWKSFQDEEMFPDAISSNRFDVIPDAFSALVSSVAIGPLSQDKNNLDWSHRFRKRSELISSVGWIQFRDWPDPMMMMMIIMIMIMDGLCNRFCKNCSPMLVCFVVADWSFYVVGRRICFYFDPPTSPLAAT